MWKWEKTGATLPWRKTWRATVPTSGWDRWKLMLVPRPAIAETCPLDPDRHQSGRRPGRTWWTLETDTSCRRPAAGWTRACPPVGLGIGKPKVGCSWTTFLWLSPSRRWPPAAATRRLDYFYDKIQSLRIGAGCWPSSFAGPATRQPGKLQVPITRDDDISRRVNGRKTVAAGG